MFEIASKSAITAALLYVIFVIVCLNTENKTVSGVAAQAAVLSAVVTIFSVFVVIWTF